MKLNGLTLHTAVILASFLIVAPACGKKDSSKKGSAPNSKSLQIIANDGFVAYRHYFSSCSASAEEFLKRYPEITVSRGKCPAESVRFVDGRSITTPLAAYCDYRGGRDYYYQPVGDDRSLEELKVICEEDSEFVGRGRFSRI